MDRIFSFLLSPFRSWVRRAAAALCVAGTVTACSDGPTAPLNASALHPIDLSAEWTPTSPDAEHVDSAVLAAGFAQSANVPALTSVVVVRHSHLVGELYLAPGGPDSAYSLRSVTKSVMSLLVGIAIHQGHVPSTTTTLATYFKPPLPLLDSTKRSISIQDLLTMTSGFQWDETDSVALYDEWISAPDEITFLTNRPLACPPGQCWNYNSAAVHLLSVILSRAIPEGTAAYANDVLFKPLGVHSAQWEVFADGYPNGGAGLYLRPRDMAKIGALVLQRGMSGQTAIVPASWIGLSTAAQSQTNPDEFLQPAGQLGYGDLWWVGRVGPHRLVLAWGYGGQFIWIVPDLDLVVVTTAAWQNVGNAAGFDANDIAIFIANQIMPAVHPD